MAQHFPIDPVTEADLAVTLEALREYEIAINRRISEIRKAQRGQPHSPDAERLTRDLTAKRDQAQNYALRLIEQTGYSPLDHWGAGK